MKKVYLITQTFPLAGGEHTFIAPELAALQKQFEVIYVPIEITGRARYSGDAKCINASSYSLLQKAVAFAKIPFQGRFYSEINKVLKADCNVPKSILYTLFISYRANLYSNFLDKKVFQKDETALVYSYWFNEICLAAVSLQERYPQYKFVTRTHGYDLFDFRSESGYQPFKEYMDSRLARVVFVCEMAKNYYLNRYKKPLCAKYICSYLGVIPQTDITYNTKSEILNIVSCSNAIPLKRIELIIQALSLIDNIKINWFHFGDGELLDSLNAQAKELLSSPNIRYTFYGYLENIKYIDWLKNSDTHLFITTSSTEGGVPVSLSESCSLAIPCIATDVGGIPEVITAENGILLPSDPTPQQISTAITDFYHLSPQEKQQKSDNAYMTWQNSFNSNVNSAAFTKLLLEI